MDGIQGYDPLKFDDRIIAMFQNIDVIRKKMPEYGYKFLMPKEKTVSEEGDDESEEDRNELKELKSALSISTTGKDLAKTIQSDQRSS